MRTIWVKDLQPNQTVEEMFQIQALKELETKAKKPYLTITIADKTGSIELKDWGGTLAGYPFKVGAIANFVFSTEEYNGKMQGKLIQTSNALTAPHAPDFFKASEYDVGAMWDHMQQFIDAFEHPHFKAVSADLFDAESTALFKDAPAASRLHHSFKHGLIEHTTQMLVTAERLFELKFYKEALNKDLCMFGIMFHDFGKIYEYSTEPGFKKRLQGLLVPHIPMVAARILESANKFAIPEMVRDHMMHVVLAHHRFLEWGSPVGFACPEAAFVHNVDNLHGGTFGLIQARAEGKEESVKYGFGSDSATILKKPFNEILKETEGVAGGF